MYLILVLFVVFEHLPHITFIYHIRYTLLKLIMRFWKMRYICALKYSVRCRVYEV